MCADIARGKALDTTGFGIEMAALPPIAEGRIDPRAWFERPANRFEIEIGSGKGTFLVQQAPLHAQTNYLGIEWAGEFYRFAADRFRRRGITNSRMLRGDATEFLAHWCQPGIAAVVHLYFSDPWPKKRHHKRRVLRDETLPVFHRVLTGAGELRLVTDHDDLWAWYEEHAGCHSDLFERQEFESPESAGGDEMVGTNYERKFAREGRPFHAMTLVRL